MTDPISTPFSPAERETFYLHYVVCALWSSDDGEGCPLDDLVDTDDISPETAAQMREDCNAFIDANGELLRSCGLSLEQAGHDLWLTRNRHGAGYWDRGIGEAGKRLTDAAHLMGGRDLYIGDDGKVYCANA